ncbi:MAG: hypothetical protein CM15mP84_07120 [Cellvibrionales bacterium]|nr:MAG: hypothetical protein CM15mP84_07120 [Cellvibrionales bacterium]
MAVGQGFEPGNLSVQRFQDRRFRPLSQPTITVPGRPEIARIISLRRFYQDFIRSLSREAPRIITGPLHISLNHRYRRRLGLPEQLALFGRNRRVSNRQVKSAGRLRRALLP